MWISITTLFIIEATILTFLRGNKLMQHIDLENKKILVTGAAGFIGAALVKELLETVTPVTVIGIDNLNEYYDVSIKEYRLKEFEKNSS